MGYAKAMLPFGDELMLQRVERILSAVVDPIVVVAADGQELPSLSPGTLVARDRQPDLGPLEGIRVGLQHIQPHARAAYVTSCDVPLLSAEFVQQMIDLLADFRIVVPRDSHFHHPLAAVYRVGVQGEIEKLLSNGQRRPKLLFGEVSTLEVTTDQLRAVDATLQSLANLNRPQDYLDALKRASLPIDPRVREQLGLDGS